MTNRLSLELKDNPDLQELISDKIVGDSVTFTVTCTIAEKTDDRFEGNVTEIEGEESEPEPEETPAVKVAKSRPAMTDEEEA